MKHSGVSIFWQYAKKKNFKSNLVLVLVPVLESKSLSAFDGWRQFLVLFGLTRSLVHLMEGVDKVTSE